MNKLARVLAILIGVSAIWLLRPDVARADTPMTITTVITEVTASRVWVGGMGCSGYPSADWTPVYTTNMVVADNNYGGWLKESYTGNFTCGSNKLIVDFGDIYTATSLSVHNYGNMTVKTTHVYQCASANCWANPTAGEWQSGGDYGWWYPQVITPTWSGVSASSSIPTRYWYWEWGIETGDANGVYLNIDAIKLILATPITTTTVITVPDCIAITNSHFISGTTGWMTASVTTAPSEAVFGAGGAVWQSYTSTNIISNGGFESGVSGWGSSWGDTVASTNSGYSGKGMLVTSAGASGLAVWRDYTVSANTDYSLSVTMKASSSITYSLQVGMFTTGWGQLSAVNVTRDDNWHTYTVNANSGTNTTIRLLFGRGSSINVAGQTFTVDDVKLVRASSIPITATAHWIGRSNETFPVNATIGISSSTGITSTMHSFSGVQSEYYDTLSGDFANGYDVIVTADKGFALDYLCLDFSGGSASGGSSTTCYTVDDGEFDGDGSEWTLSEATIADGELSLNADGSASQQVALEANQQYTVVMSATFAGASDLAVTLGDTTDAFTIPVAASLDYQKVFTTGATITDSIIGLSSDGGQVGVSYICFSQAERLYGECLPVIQNGSFETADGWIWRNGAVWNDVAGNAYIPVTDGGTWSNYGLGAIGQYPLQGTIPDLLPGEFLILQFDARSSDTAGVTARLYDRSINNSAVITYTASTGNQYTRYQVPANTMAGREGSGVELVFANTSAISAGYTSTVGVFVDNVCLYLSDTAPQIPVISPTYNGYAGGLPFTCGTVSAWLKTITGIDFPALEAMTAPSIWDVDQWVPWLASRLWVNAGHPLACILISLFNNSSVLSVINFFDWVVRQLQAIFTWQSGWWGSILLTLFGWLAWFRSGQFTWLEFLGAVITWLWDGLMNLMAWLSGSIIARIMGIVNTLIVAWNTLLPAIRTVIGYVADIFIGIWNMVAPWLGSVFSLAGLVLGLFGLIGPMILSIAGPIWQIVYTLFMLLSHNFTQTVGIPFNLYQAFDNSVNGEPFVFIPTCSDGGDLWCNFIFGIQLVNNIAGQSLMYPIVIVLIILLTIYVIRKHIWETLKPPGFH